MSIETSLEQRLTAVETALSKLQQQVSADRSPNWIEEITGTFKDEPAFDEILAYGREFRHAEEILTEESPAQ